jgi:hypothetical protein
MKPEVLELHGMYLRSIEHGVYLNVRAQDSGGHPLTQDGLLALLREQNWASPPFDEWTFTAKALTIVGGTFETTGMGGEVVLEVFATDGSALANLAGPGERTVITALIASVKRLVSTLQFSAS